jgi:hypothetical protein
VNKLALLAVLVVLGIFACWRGFAGSGDTSRDLAREAKRGQALEQQTSQIQRRLEAKQRVIVEVVAGRMGLAKAARRFAEINADGAEEIATAPAYLSFDVEAACSRNVLNWAGAALASDSAQAARILPALEEEYRQRFQPSKSGNGN